MHKIICYLVCTALCAFCAGLSLGKLIAIDNDKGVSITQLIMYSVFSGLYGYLVIDLVQKL